MKTTTLPLRDLTNLSPLPGFFLIAFALVCFALSLAPNSFGVVPAPDGGYPNGNTAEGEDALFALDTSQGTYNTAVGFDALYSNTVGFYNTAIGGNALFRNTVGIDNTAVGTNALYSNTIGGANTAVGDAALSSNTIGGDNTAVGNYALYSNTTGGANNAVGSNALGHNTSGINNTAIGHYALYLSTTGSYNTANGAEVLESNGTGSNNTANGALALLFNSTGNDNTATGVNALYNNTTGGRNTAYGSAALKRNTTGSGNIALGNGAGGNLTIGDHNIDIGNPGIDAEANTIRIGRVGTQTATFIAGISGEIVPTGVAAIIDSSGHLGTTTSSARFKDDIKPMDKASEAILALKPVTFRYKQELDPERIPQFGLVAEDVEKADPALVARDDDGKPYSVRYEAVNAMLLNEFIKEHKKVEQLEATVAKLAAAVEKVSAQIQADKPAPQIVLNNQ
jgi:hypothetical protein